MLARKPSPRMVRIKTTMAWLSVIMLMLSVVLIGALH
jgi:hypothetical protein